MGCFETKITCVHTYDKSSKITAEILQKDVVRNLTFLDNCMFVSGS